MESGERADFGTSRTNYVEALKTSLRNPPWTKDEAVKVGGTEGEGGARGERRER